MLIISLYTAQNMIYLEFNFISYSYNVLDKISTEAVAWFAVTALPSRTHRISLHMLYDYHYSF